MEFRRANSLLERGAILGLRRRALADGYLFFRGLVEAESVLQLRELVLEVCDRHGWLRKGVSVLQGIARPGMRTLAYEDPQFVQFQVEAQLLPQFGALRKHPAILGVLEAILGRTPVSQCGDVCRLSFPHSLARTTPPHQDHFFIRASTPLWTVWLPLGDCPRNLGALRVVPSSHLDGLHPHSHRGLSRQVVARLTDDQWASSDFCCGDVLFFNALTIHSANKNRTRDRVRVSVDFRYRLAPL